LRGVAGPISSAKGGRLQRTAQKSNKLAYCLPVSMLPDMDDQHHFNGNRDRHLPGEPVSVYDDGRLVNSLLRTSGRSLRRVDDPHHSWVCGLDLFQGPDTRLASHETYGVAADDCSYSSSGMYFFSEMVCMRCKLNELGTLLLILVAPTAS